ncbi:MptD family putative ECF transporter S component [Candidatus Woesearchaeota archaeon]|nr:MptD family putative ECF transporter S component [Candidatus Woesearchaeota archaeon]
MFKHFSTKELVFIAMMSASLFIVNFVTGASLVAITGVPLSNMFINGLFIALWIFITAKIVPKFGSLAVMLGVYSILSIPTFIGGAPGFWLKVPIITLAGFLGDIFLYLTKYKNWAIFIAYYILTTATMLTFAFVLFKLGIPAANKIIPIVHWLIIAICVLGTIGLFIGKFIYNRIKDKRIIQQISS